MFKWMLLFLVTMFAVSCSGDTIYNSSDNCYVPDSDISCRGPYIWITYGYVFRKDTIGMDKETHYINYVNNKYLNHKLCCVVRLRPHSSSVFGYTSSYLLGFCKHMKPEDVKKEIKLINAYFCSFEHQKFVVNMFVVKE